MKHGTCKIEGQSYKMRSPSELIVDKSTAKIRREVHFWLLALWIVPGVFLWLYLREALWFVGFMSLYAIWISHLTGWAAETPVEEEGSED
jgi:hypothetical protein